MRSFFFLSFSFLFLSFLLLRNEALHQQSAYEFQHISRNVTTYTTPYFREFLFTHKGNRCRSNCVCHSPLENYSTRDRIVLAWYDFAHSSPLLVVTISLKRYILERYPLRSLRHTVIARWHRASLGLPTDR